MSDLTRVRDILKAQEKSYREFLNIVRGACNDVATELGGIFVLRVYDRTDKQGGDALKDAIKVLDACERPVGLSTIIKVADVIGVTVVVQYPDQIGQFLDKLSIYLIDKFATEERRKIHSETYFATHATYRSHAVTHGGILCEVQCKTVLHDAWSAKMHDLTYKPLGSMDPRMKGMIEAISQSLEGIEQQSQIARDMIVSRQRGERKPFKAALAAFLSALHESVRAPSIDSMVALESEVASFAAKPGTSTGHQAIDLSARIRHALQEDDSAGAAWLIAVRFAGALADVEAFRFLGNCANLLLDRVQDLRSRDLITEVELRAIPIGFYAMQDFQKAIEHIDLLIAQSGPFGLSEECIHILKFNKATWMLERESLRPSKTLLAEGVKAEIEALLLEARSVLTFKDESAVRDTDGLFEIVYGATKEEVRRGINLCMTNIDSGNTDEHAAAVSLAYSEWRNHLGWRRYFELAESEVESDPS